MKQQQIQSTQHATLLLDQVTLRTLHEQLNAEYEDVKREQEALRKLNRDLRSEVRTFKEDSTSQNKQIAILEQEKEMLRNESKSLGNLRAEHSKLKVIRKHFESKVYRCIFRMIFGICLLPVNE